MTTPALPPASPPPSPAPRRTYNRRAFGKVDAGSPLLQLYCRMVALELALKDSPIGIPSVEFMPGGHNVFRAIFSHGSFPSQIHTSLVTVMASIQKLQCDKGPVNPLVYPDLRFLRHDSDFTVDCCSDADLRDALRLVKALISDLDAHWSAQVPPADEVVP